MVNGESRASVLNAARTKRKDGRPLSVLLPHFDGAEERRTHYRVALFVILFVGEWQNALTRIDVKPLLKLMSPLVNDPLSYFSWC
ncbi:hypothetical protein D3C73_1463720 [compost metagenome]